MKILMVLMSHDQLGNTGLRTGFWLEEGAAGGGGINLDGCKDGILYRVGSP